MKREDAKRDGRAETIRRLMQRVAELEADAARYRTIRDHFSRVASPKMDGVHTYGLRAGWPGLRGVTFDAAVDAAAAEIQKAITEAEGTHHDECS